MSFKEKEKNERIKLQKKFGSQLTNILKSKGITSAELARLSFMERSSIARIEKGKVNPSLFILKRLANALDINLADLVNNL